MWSEHVSSPCCSWCDELVFGLPTENKTSEHVSVGQVLRGTRNAYLHQSWTSVVLGVGRCCVVEFPPKEKMSSLHFTIYRQFEKTFAKSGLFSPKSACRQGCREITRGAALDLDLVDQDFDTILKASADGPFQIV